jgi:hypothetical protein
LSSAHKLREKGNTVEGWAGLIEFIPHLSNVPRMGNMEKTNKKIEMAIISAISVGFVIWSAVFIYRSSFIAIDGKRYFCLFDDAMISMRYAWNFSHGFGLVWNSGEYVQGFTNLLMTLFMSVTTLIFDKSTAALFVQISGVVFMLVIAYVSLRIADFIVEDQDRQRKMLINVLAFFCALSYYPLVYWSLMGMETGLLTMLLLLGILSALKYSISLKPIHLLSVAGYLGLAYATRNDSIIFAFLIWAYIIWENPGIKNDLRNVSHFLEANGLYILIIFAQGVFQYLYYGEWLPNTYTLKLTGMPLLFRISNGIGFIKPFLSVIVFLLVISIIGLVFDFSKRKLFLLSFVISVIGYQIYIGGDPWNYWRIMSPTIPLLCILFIGSLNTGLHALDRAKAFVVNIPRNLKFPKTYAAWLLILFTLLGLLTINWGFFGEISLLKRPYTTENNQSSVDDAIAIDQLTRSDASIGVFWAGAIPYFSGRTAIDFLGKSDRYIAHLPPDMSGAVGGKGMTSLPGHNKYDLNYSIKVLKPTVVQSFKWGKQDLRLWAKTTYVPVKYQGVILSVLKNSPAILWEKADSP